MKTFALWLVLHTAVMGTVLATTRSLEERAPAEKIGVAIDASFAMREDWAKVPQDARRNRARASEGGVHRSDRAGDGRNVVGPPELGRRTPVRPETAREADRDGPVGGHRSHVPHHERARLRRPRRLEHERSGKVTIGCNSQTDTRVRSLAGCAPCLGAAGLGREPGAHSGREEVFIHTNIAVDPTGMRASSARRIREIENGPDARTQTNPALIVKRQQEFGARFDNECRRPRVGFRQPERAEPSGHERRDQKGQSGDRAVEGHTAA